MTAQVYQIRDYQSKRELERLRAQEETAAKYLDQGRDLVVYESSAGFIAPESDPA